MLKFTHINQAHTETCNPPPTSIWSDFFRWFLHDEMRCNAMLSVRFVRILMIICDLIITETDYGI